MNFLYTHFITTDLLFYYHLSKNHIVTLLLLFVPHNSHQLDASIPAKPHRITRGFALIRLLTVPHLNIIKWMSDWFMTK